MGYYAHLLLLTKAVILLLCCLSDVHGITEYYVKPAEFDNTSCPGEPCHTLSHFASNTHYAWSGVVVRFLPGNHSLNQSLYISSSSNLHLTSFEPVTSIQNLSVNIHCPSMANFHFYNVSNIKIDGLGFYNCGIITQGTLYLQHVTNFLIDFITIQSWRTTAFAVRVKNEFGYGRLVISHSEFRDLYIHIDCNPHYQNAIIGNHLIISKSIFKGSGLSIHLIRNAIVSHIEISDNVFSSSRSKPISLSADQSAAMVHIRNCLVTDSLHGVLHFELTANPWLLLTIENSVISNNIVTDVFEGGAGVTVYRETAEKEPVIILRNVSFLHNEKFGGMYSAIVALRCTNDVTFTDCKFYGNRGTAIGAYQSTFYMNGYNTFINNSATKGGAIALLDNSYMFIQNNTQTLFQNNYADVGGAIFVQNIPVIDFLLHLLSKCPIVLLMNAHCSDLTANITLSFTSNVGRDGGDIIYGTKFYKCITKCKSLWHIVAGYWKVLDGVHINVDALRNDSFSLLSSDPMRVCICTNGTPDCTTVFMNMTKYPGEAFNVPAVVVGDNFGTVTGSVHSKFLSLGTNRTVPNLEEFQNLQRFSRSAGCAELQYTVLSENEKEVMILTIQEVTTIHYGSQSEVDELVTTYEKFGESPPELLTYPVYINITLLPCLLGFILHNSQHRCVCHSQLEEHNITCNISDQTVHRSGNMWLNASFVGNATNGPGVIIHRYCPFDYCKR